MSTADEALIRRAGEIRRGAGLDLGVIAGQIGVPVKTLGMWEDRPAAHLWLAPGRPVREWVRILRALAECP